MSRFININIAIGILIAVLLAGTGMLIYLYSDLFKPVDPVLKRDLEFWDKRVQENPGNGFAHANLAAAYLDVDKKEEAIKEFRKALELQPEEYTYMHRLGIAYRMNANFTQAIDMFNQAAERYPDGEKYASFHQIAEIYFERGDIFLSKEFVQKAIDDNELIWNSHFLLGKILETEGDLENARKEFQQAAKFNAEDRELQDALKRIGV